MTVGELMKMSPQERAALYDKVQGSNNLGAINSETDSIEDVINAYANTEIPLDDMEELKKDILAAVA